MLKSMASVSCNMFELLLILMSRFSKLFMSHLDAEFKEQADPAVKMLIESQVWIPTSFFPNYLTVAHKRFTSSSRVARCMGPTAMLASTSRNAHPISWRWKSISM
jgi:hypothetical protein